MCARRHYDATPHTRSHSRRCAISSHPRAQTKLTVNEMLVRLKGRNRPQCRCRRLRCCCGVLCFVRRDRRGFHAVRRRVRCEWVTPRRTNRVAREGVRNTRLGVSLRGTARITDAPLRNADHPDSLQSNLRCEKNAGGAARRDVTRCGVKRSRQAKIRVGREENMMEVPLLLSFGTAIIVL